MAEKSTAAPAARSAVSGTPLKPKALRTVSHDGVGYPAFVSDAPAPRTGSTVSLTAANGVTYSGKVRGHYEDAEGTIVYFEGLEPVRDEPAPE